MVPHRIGRLSALRDSGRAGGERLRQLAGALASLIFPAPCGLCGKSLEGASRIPICGPCLNSLGPRTGPLCRQCGRPFASTVAAEGSTAGLCHGCRRGLYDFDLARSYGAYSPAMARAIMLLKYQQVTPLAGWFAGRLLPLAREYGGQIAADVVVPVPLHPARLRERGYNQAEMIARPLARQIGLPCRSYLLVRTRPRPDKRRLTLRERWRSVRNAFVTRETSEVDKLRVLLVDDVITTGATLDACSRALRQAGATYVAALTVARTVLRGQGAPAVGGVPGNATS